MSTTPTGPHGPDRGHEAEQATAAEGRSTSWVLIGMVACCAGIPLALVVVAVANGWAFASVSLQGWAILAAAFVAALGLASRMARSPSER